ncbi:MAG: hypothetical protein AAB874_00180, partial [Patescibacteria group bacterium]
ARYLFANTLAGFLSALVYGILPSIMSLMYPEVAADRFAIDFIEPRRFTILVRWGEGPHVVGLFFVCISAWFLVKFLREGSKWWLFFGAVMTALTLLTNSIAAWGLAILAFSLLFGEAAGKDGSWRTVFGRGLVFAAVSFGFVVFWFNSLFLTTFFREGSNAGVYWRDQFPWGWLAIAAVLVIYFLISKKILASFKGAAAGILFFGLMFFLVNTYYASGAEKLELVPQVLRLTTEVDLGLGLIIGLVVSGLAGLARKKSTLFYYVATAVFSLGLVPLFYRQLELVKELPQYTQSAEKKNIDLSKSAEYEVASELKNKVTGDERVFVPGNYSFYLNYF